MKSCWKDSPHKRPTFSFLLSELDKMESTTQDGQVLETGGDEEDSGIQEDISATSTQLHIEEVDSSWSSVRDVPDCQL